MPAITIPLVPCWRLFPWFSVKSSFTGAVRDIQNLIIYSYRLFLLEACLSIEMESAIGCGLLFHLWATSDHFDCYGNPIHLSIQKHTGMRGVGCSAFYIPGVNPLDPMFLWFSCRISYNMKLTTEKVKESCDVHRNSDTFYEQNQASWKKKRIQKSSVSVHNISSVLYYLFLQKKYSSS